MTPVTPGFSSAVESGSLTRPRLMPFCWWVPVGHRPSLAEAAERLEQLRQRGPTSTAFTFGKMFDAP